MPLIQNLGIEIQRAKNMHKARSIVYFFIAISNVFISIPLVKWIGPIGAALETAISLTAGNILFMNWYYYTHIGLDIWYFWKKIAGFIPGLVIPCIIGMLIKIFVPMNTLVSLGIMIIIYTVIFVVSMYCLGMNGEERKMISGPIYKIFKKEKNNG